MVGRADATKLPFAGEFSCKTGGTVSTERNVEVKGTVCIFPVGSVSPFTLTVKLLLAGSGADGVNTACAGVTSVVVPETGPEELFTVIRFARLLLVASGSLKFTVMALPLAT